MREREQVDWIVRRFERGFSNSPADRGGATKFGVSQRLMRARLGRDVTVDEIRNLTYHAAIDILCDEFVAKPKLYEIDDDLLRLLVIDYAIHSGAGAAVRCLQEARGVDADGIFGPITKRAVNQPGIGPWLCRQVIACRLRHIGGILANHPTQALNAEGWLDRVAVLSTLQLPPPDPGWSVPA